MDPNAKYIAIEQIKETPD